VSGRGKEPGLPWFFSLPDLEGWEEGLTLGKGHVQQRGMDNGIGRPRALRQAIASDHPGLKRRYREERETAQQDRVMEFNHRGKEDKTEIQLSVLEWRFYLQWHRNCKL
jgi:hypothetical protein